MTLSLEEYADKEDSLLLKLIKMQDWTAVESLMKEKSNLAQVPDIYDNLPLHVAIGYKAPERILMDLLEAYPQATKIHGTDDWLPLHVAAMWGVPSIVMEALILAHPQALDDPGEKGIKGRTPRHFSGRFQHNTKLLERSTEEWVRLAESHRLKKTQ